MKAIVIEKYGLPDVLDLREVAQPNPKDSEVLIQVKAAAVNSWDWDFLRGRPRVFRLFFGLFKPKFKILGCDVAGKVVEVGRNVKSWKIGDEVFGDLSAGHWGGFAEYVCAHEKYLVKKPTTMSFEQAASLPQAAVLALQGLGDKQKIGPGDKVLINGAGGGVGGFAIQMAKYFGAEVTGVDSRAKFEMMKSLGADHVIDYKKEDFTKNDQKYDLIIDVVTQHSVFDYQRVLNKNGCYAMIGGKIGRIFQIMFLGLIISMFSDKNLGIIAHQPNKDLDVIIDLIGQGHVKHIIDKTYPLSGVPKALQYLGDGQAKGKLVISI